MSAKSLQLLVIALGLAACAATPEVTPSSAPLTQIEDIVANPSSFNDQLVLIRGTAVVEFEGVFVCPSAAVIEHGEPNQCLWLTASESSGRAIDLRPFHLKNVELLGSVNSRSKGHMGLFSASFQVTSGRVLGHHGMKDFRPPPPPSSAN